MAKKRKRKSSVPASVPLAPAQLPGSMVVINPFGETDSRRIVRQRVLKSSFKLSDGTTLRVWPIIGDVRRAIGQFNDKGQPLYLLTVGHRIETEAPRKLLKKMSKKKKKVIRK
ncbi:MAG: hypothetical protein K8H87_07990 [Pseudorhodoplanes sp.]|nr:hypothetical protein [Pseudorhodoplanes sp.]